MGCLRGRTDISYSSVGGKHPENPFELESLCRAANLQSLQRTHRSLVLPPALGGTVRHRGCLLYPMPLLDQRPYMSQKDLPATVSLQAGPPYRYPSAVTTRQNTLLGQAFA